MRLALLIALAAAPAAPAFAQDAPASGVDVDAPICTTTTVVIKRGDVVLSSSSNTRCETPPPARGQGGGQRPGAALRAPEAVLRAPEALASSFAMGHGEELTLRNSPADWRVIEHPGEQVCHLVLNARSGPEGLLARSHHCRGALSHASTWSFQDGSVEVKAADGAIIVRLTGDRMRLFGDTADGGSVELQR